MSPCLETYICCVEDFFFFCFFYFFFFFPSVFLCLSVFLSFVFCFSFPHPHSSKVSNKKQAVLSLFTAAAYIGLGLSSLIIALQNPNSGNVPVCGFGGSPPLREWVYGTGIAYLTIGAGHILASLLLCSVWCLVFGVIPVIIILLFGGIFTFAWTIVGAVSLWRDGAGSCCVLIFLVL